MLRRPALCRFALPYNVGFSGAPSARRSRGINPAELCVAVAAAGSARISSSSSSSSSESTSSSTAVGARESAAGAARPRRHFGNVSAMPLGTYRGPYRSSDSSAFTRRKSFTPRDLRLRFLHPPPLLPLSLSSPPFTPHIGRVSMPRRKALLFSGARPLVPPVRRASLRLRDYRPSNDHLAKYPGEEALINTLAPRGTARGAIAGRSKLDAGDRKRVRGDVSRIKWRFIVLMKRPRGCATMCVFVCIHERTSVS